MKRAKVDYIITSLKRFLRILGCSCFKNSKNFKKAKTDENVTKKIYNKKQSR